MLNLCSECVMINNRDTKMSQMLVQMYTIANFFRVNNYFITVLMKSLFQDSLGGTIFKGKLRIQVFKKSLSRLCYQQHKIESEWFRHLQLIWRNWLINSIGQVSPPNSITLYTKAEYNFVLLRTNFRCLKRVKNP